MMNTDIIMMRVEQLVKDARHHQTLGRDYQGTFLKLVKQANELLEKVVIFTRKEMEK